MKKKVKLRTWINGKELERIKIKIFKYIKTELKMVTAFKVRGEGGH